MRREILNKKQERKGGNSGGRDSRKNGREVQEWWEDFARALCGGTQKRWRKKTLEL
jgi:hypothetical protein